MQMLLCVEVSVWRVVIRLGDKSTVIYFTRLSLPIITFLGSFFQFYFKLISVYLVYFKQKTELCRITSLIQSKILKNISKNKIVSM